MYCFKHCAFCPVKFTFWYCPVKESIHKKRAKILPTWHFNVTSTMCTHVRYETWQYWFSRFTKTQLRRVMFDNRIMLSGFLKNSITLSGFQTQLLPASDRIFVCFWQDFWIGMTTLRIVDASRIRSTVKFNYWYVVVVLVRFLRKIHTGAFFYFLKN